MLVRKFKQEDAIHIAEMMAKTLSMTNADDYSDEYIKDVVHTFLPQYLIERASWTNFYVVCEENQMIGCGAIGPYWGKTDESSLFNIVVLPEYQGKGIGRKIIETLENDEYFLRAKRIEVPASTATHKFYIKMGYDYKNGITSADEEWLFRLEKHRE